MATPLWLHLWLVTLSWHLGHFDVGTHCMQFAPIEGLAGAPALAFFDDVL